MRSGSSPSSVLVPSSIVIGRSVVLRRVKQRTPSAEVSSWTPPESVRTKRAADSRPRNAQVARKRTTQRQAHHVVADFLFKRVDRLVVADDALGGVVVAAFDHVQCGLELRGGHFPHAQEFAQQAALLVVEALDDVVVRVAHLVLLPLSFGKRCPKVDKGLSLA